MNYLKKEDVFFFLTKKKTKTISKKINKEKISFSSSFLNFIYVKGKKIEKDNSYNVFIFSFSGYTNFFLVKKCNFFFFLLDSNFLYKNTYLNNILIYFSDFFFSKTNYLNNFFYNNYLYFEFNLKKESKIYIIYHLNNDNLFSECRNFFLLNIKSCVKLVEHYLISDNFFCSFNCMNNFFLNDFSNLSYFRIIENNSFGIINLNNKIIQKSFTNTEIINFTKNNYIINDFFNIKVNGFKNKIKFLFFYFNFFFSKVKNFISVHNFFNDLFIVSKISSVLFDSSFFDFKCNVFLSDKCRNNFVKQINNNILFDNSSVKSMPSYNSNSSNNELIHELYISSLNIDHLFYLLSRSIIKKKIFDIYKNSIINLDYLEFEKKYGYFFLSLLNKLIFELKSV